MAADGARPLRREIVWLDDRELRWHNRLAGAAVPVFLLLYQPWLTGERTSRLALSGFGLAFVFAFWIVGRMRHRLWAGFSAFLMGLFAPWSYAYIVGALYVAYAFWVVWHAYRDLKEPAEPPTPT